MKKLFIFFIVLISLVVVAGCKKQPQANSNTEKQENLTVFTETKDKEKEMPAIKITDDSEFKITNSENNPITLDKEKYTIEGQSSENTNKILVNEKEITFKAGEKNWFHTVSVGNGNLKLGKNELNFKALDQDGNIIGKESRTIVINNNTDSLAATGTPYLIYLLNSIIALIGGSLFIKK